MSEHYNVHRRCIVEKHYDGIVALFKPNNTYYTYAIKTGAIAVYRHKPAGSSTIDKTYKPKRGQAPRPLEMTAQC